MIEELRQKHLDSSLYMAAALVAAANTAQDNNDSKTSADYLLQAEAVLSGLDAKSDGREKADIYKNLADIYHEQGSSKAELEARLHSIDNYKTIKYSDNQDQVELAENLLHAGGCALKLKDFDQASKYYAEALAKARSNQEVKLGLKNDKEPLQKDWQKDLREYLKQSQKHIRDRKTDTPQVVVLKAQETEIKDLLADDKINKANASVD